MLLILVCLGLATAAAWRNRHVCLWLWATEYAVLPPRLEMPVTGLELSDTCSSWHAPRSGGRLHQGADLFAERGTPVVSATRGVVWRVGNDPLGGRVVWVLGEGRSLYYYAHLDDWAPGLRSGQRVHAGDALGDVGNTGNARTTPPHLHFGVYRVHLLRVEAVNPLPILARGREQRPVRRCGG